MRKIATDALTTQCFGGFCVTTCAVKKISRKLSLLVTKHGPVSTGWDAFSHGSKREQHNNRCNPNCVIVRLFELSSAQTVMFLKPKFQYEAHASWIST